MISPRAIEVGADSLGAWLRWAGVRLSPDTIKRLSGNYLTALAAEGMVVVPAEPTLSMEIAGAETLPDYDPGCDHAGNCYRAMINAAQPAEGEK